MTLHLKSIALVLSFTWCITAIAADAPASAREAAPHDLTGNWVSLVTEDWRYRMMTAPAGDFPGVPLTPLAQQIANAWDPEADIAAGLACKAYGAGGIMRIPTRLQIRWASDNVLSIETDAGKQTRLLKFGTTSMQPGYFRRNGIPYGEQARMTEYFELVTETNGDQYLIVISVLEDPQHLTQPVITSTNFKREPDDSKWNPSDCVAK
jgi:hypothetical protein